MRCVGNSVPAVGAARAKSLRPELDVRGAAGCVPHRALKGDEAGQEGPEEGVKVMQGLETLLAP